MVPRLAFVVVTGRIEDVRERTVLFGIGAATVPVAYVSIIRISYFYVKREAAYSPMEWKAEGPLACPKLACFSVEVIPGVDGRGVTGRSPETDNGPVVSPVAMAWLRESP